MNSADLLQYLRAFKALAVPTLEGFVLDNGKLFEDRRVNLLEHQVHEKSKECYNNAWKYKTRRPRSSGLRYCEGFVLLPIGFTVMHGWLLTSDNEIIDPSVNQWDPAIYYGIVFKEDFARQCWAELRRRHSIGILGNLWQLGIPLNELNEGLEQ